MSIASMAHVFESGINAAPSNTGGLETLVRRQLDLFAKEREQQARENAARSAPPGPTPFHVPPRAQAQAPAPAPALGPVPASAASASAPAPAIKSEPPEGPATPATLAPVSPEDLEKNELSPGPATNHAPARRQTKSNTIMTETGDYLVQVASTYARLTTNLVSGAHVEMAVMEQHEQSRLTTSFTDMSVLVAMDIEQTRLRKIQYLTDKFFRDVQETWNPNAVPVSPEPVSQQTPSAHDAIRPFARVPLPTAEVETPKPPVVPKPDPSSQASPDKTSPTATADVDVTMSDDSEDEEEETFAKIDMDALRQRGKGSYYCPFGHRCDKGGVDKAGNLVLFDRNSSFAYTTLQ
ncbi:hypothetical protein B0T10DRAFT_558432 [Thelonectria olida]|uniref:Uncharacterized protein n=1 Tax=Thelonectria olida TaxID=1576542 RepID=A0A9P9APZ7_9HYPO|nr:hypothetical protein B0T10DRAFT_558432 [Thelonectria olida]